MRYRLSVPALLSGLMFFVGCADEPTPANPSKDKDMTATADATPDLNSPLPDASEDLKTSPEDMPDSEMSPPDDMGKDLGDMMTPPVMMASRQARCAALSASMRQTTQGDKVISVKSVGAGQVEVGGQRKTLREVVNGAQDSDIIELEDGTYTFPEASGANSYTGLYFTKANVTLRSRSGDASAVILDSEYRDLGGSTAPITISAPGITIMDLSVKRSIFHLIHISGDKGDDTVVQNVRLIDGGQQFFKSSAGSGTIDDGVISCSDFTMTAQGRDNAWGYGGQNGNTTCYTGGIDTHEAKNWKVTDNRFEGIYCNAGGVQRPAHGKKGDQRGGMTYTGGLSEHAIHMWDSPQGSGHLVARNQIINCARGIGFGFRAEVYGAKVLNNMIFTEHAGSREHDVAISLERAHDSLVAHNTVMATHPQAYSSSIEYRFNSTANLKLLNNLTSHRIRSRDNAQGTLDGNVTEAKADWFKDAPSGELHLKSCDIVVIAGKAEVSEVMDDLDGQPRGQSPDVGADQCVP